MLLRKIRKALRLKNIVQYAIFTCVLWISYRFYVAYQAGQEAGRYKAYGPRDIWGGRRSADVEGAKNQDIRVDRKSRLKDAESDDILHRDDKTRFDHEKEGGPGSRDNVAAGERGRGADHRGKEEVVDMNVEEKEKDGDSDGGKLSQKKAGKKDFKVKEEVDWVLEEELQKRRKRFLDDVMKRAEEYDPEDFKDILEADDHLAFITAATDETSWMGLLQFVYSVQYFYPKSDIGIYDLGLSAEKREQLSTFCRVSVNPTFTKFWPDHLKDPSMNLWRPMIWQMGLAHYGHIIYVEPERFLYKKNMKDYIEHSRRHGITVVGRKFQYSPYVVTHPEMYHFLNVDTRKLQRVNLFDVTMILMHNSQPVRHEFMRYLVSCTLEEYCIAPPGAKPNCDQRLYSGSKKYAHCHRYDKSAVNILMNKWFEFRQDDFLVKDVATAHYDGMDVSQKVKVCQGKEEM